MNTRLTQIDIQHFRGATNPCKIHFDKTKPLVVVFGENGTGKSTIVDAFDLIANAEIGTIRDRSSAKSKHAPAIGKKITDIGITLHQNGSKWSGTMKGNKINVLPLENRPRIEILRRKQLLNFVEAAPGKRHETLQPFIDVRGVEASEKSALDAINHAKRDNDEAIKKKLDAEVALNDLWEANGKPGNSWQEWAASEIALSPAERDQEISSLNSVIKAIEDFNSKKTTYDSAVASTKVAKDELESIEKEIAGLSSAWSVQTPLLIDTLVATENLLNGDWSEDTCPVCKQSIPPDTLRARVAENLASLNTVKSVYDRQQAALKTLEAKKVTLERNKEKIIVSIRSLVDAALESKCDEFTDTSFSIIELADLLKNKTLDDTTLGKCIDGCVVIANLHITLTDLCADLNRNQNQFHTITTGYSSWVDAEKAIHETEALSKQLEVIHNLIVKNRKAFVQKILDSVENEASRLYKIIHPNEDTKTGGLKLDPNPNKRASLNLYAVFAGEADVEPQGYFSDSHLDTLGFCYWLALAKRENPESKIVVLDDVFTSVDAAHFKRIIELLDTECLHFAQMFTLTHHRNWRDRYRYNQAAGRQAQLIELRRWTSNRGLCHNKTELELDELVELLGRFASGEEGADRQDLASRCGILLEAILSHLSQNYQCRVPHRTDGDYTLGDLTSGCQSLMKKLQVQKCQETLSADDDANFHSPEALHEVFEELCGFLFIRNQVGCHFNLAGASLSDAEIEQFGEATIAFAKAIVCEHCGEIPRTDKSLFRQCSCKKTRLLPAKL